MQGNKKEKEPQKEVDKLTETTEVIKILSQNGHVFFVNRDVVEVSKHLKTSLSSTFIEGQTKEIKLDID